MIHLTFEGHCGFDAVQKQENGGSPYIRFSVAVNDKRKGIESTQWINVFSRNLALAQYLTKGTRVMVLGRASMKSFFHERSNSYQVDISVNASIIQLLGSPKETPQPAPMSMAQATEKIYAPAPPSTPPADGQQVLPGMPSVTTQKMKDDDDLPF